MLGWLKHRRNVRRTARSLYGSIVTQARGRIAYEHWGVPDTPEGRFEMIMLHLTLVLRRLAKAGEPGRALAQALTEVFVVDVDDTLREMTVGDLAVPRHVKRAVALLRERYQAYDAALASSEPEAALERAVGQALAALSGAGSLDAPRICAYTAEAARALERTADAQLLGGEPEWPMGHQG
jgi:cytochrome b pre-mRNA-processing protein 3